MRGAVLTHQRVGRRTGSIGMAGRAKPAPINIVDLRGDSERPLKTVLRSQEEKKRSYRPAADV